MYKLGDCIRLGLIVGVSLGAALELLVAFQGSEVTAVEFLIRSAYGIAHAAAST